MAGRIHFGGKRELLARGLFWSGVPFLLGRLPDKNLLTVLNYHRVGIAQDDIFDPDVFSVTADQLDQQISFLKSHVALVTLGEALAFIDGNAKTRCCRVLLTFDDGYLDNYQVAFPVLRSHGVHAVFFLASGLVGSCYVPWWDHIAYLLKTARRRQFTLRYPGPLAVNVEQEHFTNGLRRVQSLYTRPDCTDSSTFIRELRESCGGEDPPKTGRRFLSWDEARTMICAGMAVGSHTLSHQVLSQMSLDRQRHELSESRALFREQLGIDADALAYPVGLSSSFSGETQVLAREAGYRAAFSFYGGTNLPGRTNPYDVRRIGVGGQSRPRFEVQTAVCKLTGNFWP